MYSKLSISKYLSFSNNVDCYITEYEVYDSVEQTAVKKLNSSTALIVCSVWNEIDLKTGSIVFIVYVCIIVII